MGLLNFIWCFLGVFRSKQNCKLDFWGQKTQFLIFGDRRMEQWTTCHLLRQKPCHLHNFKKRIIMFFLKKKNPKTQILSFW